MSNSEAKKEENVWIHDEASRVIFYREVAKPSKETLFNNFKQVVKLSEAYQSFYLIIDLSNSERPSAETREHIAEELNLIKDKIVHLAIFTEKNFLLNMAVTFTFSKVNLESYSIHKTLEEAEQAIEEIRK